MSVLDPRELQASPLADLHTLASELGLEGFRRLRKEELIEQIIAVQGGAPAPEAGAEAAAEAEIEAVEAAPADAEAVSADAEAAPADAEAAPDDAEAAPDDAEASLYEDAASWGGRPSDKYTAPGAYSGDEDLHEGATGEVPRDYQVPMPNWEQEREQEAAAATDGETEAPSEAGAEREEDLRGGVLDVLPNGSGFIRAEPYRQSRDDVYVSPAQIRRCELRPGDEVTGPVRPPRRNERHPSLVRVATVNGADADVPAERPRFESLTPIWPTERLAGPKVLAELPFGKGSRVAIGGPPGAGATFLLREAVKVLRERHPEVNVTVVLAGVRPEEAGDWGDLGVEVAGGGYDGSFDEQAQVAELAVQRAKRALEAGRDVAVVIDSLDALPPSTSRRVFGAGRNAAEAGSLTVLASTGTSAEPHRVATTHITLEPREGDEPRVGPGSGTLRRDLLA